MILSFFSIFASVFSVIVCILLVILIFMFAKYNKIANAVIKTVDDEKLYDQKHDLSINNNLSEPVILGNAFDTNIARYAADLIARIQVLFYQDHTTKELIIPDEILNHCILYYNNKVVGCIAKSKTKKQVWIIFRGTVDKQEWKHDLQFDQNIINNSNFSCHSGFLQIYNSFREHISHTLSSISDIAECKILVSGYSLGGALATIAALEFSNSYKNVYVYVFGCPRVCESIPLVFKSFWRVNNTEDVIKDIPLPVMPNLKEIKRPLIYTHAGDSKNFTKNLKSLSANHRLQLYISALDEGLI